MKKTGFKGSRGQGVRGQKRSRFKVQGSRFSINLKLKTKNSKLITARSL
jgi:hypothetical protein